MNWARFKEVLEKASRLHESRKDEENIFSICGFPHYERVASNVLSFFLDANREHNLRDLLLKSLLSFIVSAPEENGNDFTVETEVATDSGKYIDILVQNDDFSIVIENKIYANLYNDLDDYFRYAEQEERNVIGIILCIRSIESSDRRFVPITYKALFDEVQKNIGKYLISSNDRYLRLLLDFFDNIEDLTEGVSMDHEFLNFINENKDEISKLNRKMKQVHDDFRREVIKLSAIIREKYDQDDIRQWEWRHLPDLFDISVTDITLGNKDLCIHTIIDSSSWSFEIFDRNQKNSSDSLATILENGNISYDIVNGRFKLQKTFGLEESREVIADETLSLLRMLKSGLS